MALTALEVVTRAMQKLRVIGPGKEPKGSEAEFGLAELNDMLAEWSVDGIDLAPLTLGLSDELDIPDDHNSAIILTLALRIGGIYGAQLTPPDIVLLDRGMAVLRAYHWSMNDLSDDNPLRIRNLSNTD
jgi:hypothetical protein